MAKKSTKKSTKKKTAKKSATKMSPTKRKSKKTTAKKLPTVANNLCYGILCELINFQLNSDSYSSKIQKSTIDSKIIKKIDKWIGSQGLGSWQDVSDEVIIGSYSDDENQVMIFAIRSQETVDCFGTFTFFSDRNGGLTFLGQDIECRD